MDVSNHETKPYKIEIEQELQRDVLVTAKPRRIYKCSFCGEVLSNGRKLAKHRKTHLPPKVGPSTYDEVTKTYTCNTCNEKVSTLEEMTAHLDEHEEKFQCEYCEQIIAGPIKFCEHTFHHTNDAYRCPYCDFKSDKLPCARVHIRDHLGKKNHSCRYCGKGFNYKRAYEEHELTFCNTNKLFQCVVCNKNFHSTSLLKKHQMLVHVVNFEFPSNKCTVCSAVFLNADAMKRHMKRRHGKLTKYLCDFCGKEFNYHDKLTAHYRIHTGEKPFSCKYCEKSFSKKQYLDMHERIHTGERPFSCTTCGKSFNQRAPLTTHMRIHTGERPYICLVCETGFISKGALDQHKGKCTGCKQ